MTDTTATSAEQDLVARWQKYIHASPYNRELGVLPQAAQPDWFVLKVDYKDACGFSIFMKLPEIKPMATLDLRMDYLKPATPGRAILGGAVCYKLTSELAFVRGAAYHETPDDPIAMAVGIYMFTSGRPVITEKVEGMQ